MNAAKSPSPKDKQVEALNRAIAQFEQNNLNEAELSCSDILSSLPVVAKAMLILGAIRGGQERYDEAYDLIKRADALTPGDLMIQNNLAILELKCKNFAAAETHFKQVLSAQPRFADARYNYGLALEELDRNAEAIEQYRLVLESAPRHVRALANYARLMERSHDLEEAVAAAEKAISIYPDEPTANMTIAAIDLRAGRSEDCVKRLSRLQKTGELNSSERVDIHGLLGDAFEKLENYPLAFDSFDTANRQMAEDYAAEVVRPSAYSPASVAQLTQYFSTADMTQWSATPPETQRSPCFLVGFPRSGTTLLDQLLSSHPAIETLEEKGNLIDMCDDYLLDEASLDRLAAMSPEKIVEYREKYWRRVHEHANIQNDSVLLVDKLPLDIVLLGVIYRLFPNARIIFAIRDPRDVVLSCFKQRFSMNPAMYQFLNLDTAAAYYDQVMTLGEICAAKFPLQIHYVKYEDVVSDLRTSLEPTLELLKLKWDDAIFEYAENAKRRTINTPSARQVINPLYQSSIGKWRHYKAEMASVLPVLKHWVNQFEYD